MLANLCYLFDDKGRVLLGIAPGGPCKGLLNGLGGKYEGNEDPYKDPWSGMFREANQESGVSVMPGHTMGMGRIDFYFLDEKKPRCRVWIYVSRGWEGEPTPREKMKGFVWVPYTELPFDRMSAADPLWLPYVLGTLEEPGMIVSGSVRFGETVKTVVNQELIFRKA